VLLATLTLCASAADISGAWKLRVTDGVIHKTIAYATFEFKVDGSSLTGTAHIGNSEYALYPGAAPISEGRVEGDHLSFRVVGRSPSSNGLPVMTFHGAIRGDHIDLTMRLIDGYVDTGDTELAGAKLNRIRRRVGRRFSADVLRSAHALLARGREERS
jgi:hypothetical protein